MLRAGYGVEDIAIKLTEHKTNTSPDMVRMEVRRLRDNGNLMPVLGLGQKGKPHGIRKDERSGDHQPTQPPAKGNQG